MACLPSFFEPSILTTPSIPPAAKENQLSQELEGQGLLCDLRLISPPPWVVPLPQKGLVTPTPPVTWS